MSNENPDAEDVGAPRKPWRRGHRERVARAIASAIGVLAAAGSRYPWRAVGRERGDRHRLDHRVRVARSITTRSLNVPGSDSSALQIEVVGA